MGPRWRWVATLAALLLALIGLDLARPQIVRYWIDTAQQGGAMPALAGAALLYLGVAVLVQGVALAELAVAENLGWLTTNALREDLTRHVLALDMSFHHAHPPGELIERIDGDVGLLEHFFSRFVLRVVNSAVLLAGLLVLLFREDVRVGFVLLCFCIAALLVMDRLRGAGARYALETRRASAALFGFLEERLTGLVEIQAVGAANEAMTGFSRRLRAMIHWGRTAMFLGGVLGGVTTGVFTLGAAAALALGAYLVRGGTLTVGTVYLIFQYTAMLREPLGQLTREARSFQGAAASISRVRELAAARPSLVDGPGEMLPDGALSVELNGASLTYPRVPGWNDPTGDGEGNSPSEPELRAVSLLLAPGRVLGVLGRTGSGKTTLARLLCRLYDPTAGTVRLGGVDLRRARLADVQRRVGVVTQEVQLFASSLRDNLTLFDPHIPDSAVLAALAEVGLDGWAAALPAGLDTPLVAGGGGMSAGEAQLLVLARVFLRDPGLVILDEASSRLDPATEARVEQAVERLLAGRTAVVIAHRLATVERADEIVVLEDGQVVEHGTRAALAAQGTSRYAALLRRGRGEVLV